jgi:hypothetical protein
MLNCEECSDDRVCVCCDRSKSAPNTLTRPHMDQSANMYSQRTPQPLARTPMNFAPFGEDSNSSLMSASG